MWRQSTIGIIWNALWEYTKGYRSLLICLTSFLTICQFADLISPYAIGKVINILQADGQSGATAAMTWVYVLMGVRVFDIIVGDIAMAFEKKLMRVASHSFLKDFYKKTRTLPILWHQEHHSGDLISRMNKANNAMGNFVGAPAQLIWIGIGFFGPAFILLKIMPVIGIFVSVTCIITVFISVYFDNKIKQYGKITNAIYHKVLAALNDYLGNIRTIITLHLGTQTSNDIGKRLKDAIPPFNMETRFKLVRWITTQSLMEATVILSLIYVLSAFEKGDKNIPIGNIVMIVTYLRQMAVSVYNSSRYYGTLVQSITDYEGFSLVNDAYIEHCKTHQANEYEIGQWTNAKINNLSFYYPTQQNHPALDNLSFNFKAGQKIALVGTSGGGKSTLMSILRGLYPAQQGRVEIDDQSYDTIEPLASFSTLIPQDPEIFENTIRYNITLGVEHSEDEIIDACRIACFDTVINELPNGLDSKINEKGVNLSGGQKQRLALARGIFAIRDSSLVLFDEPTSSVDSLTERRMYTNLFEAFPDICLISSIHRLNLLNQFDTIWVMQNGKLVQQGDLTSLLQDTNAPFYALYSAYQDSEND